MKNKFFQNSYRLIFFILCFVFLFFNPSFVFSDAGYFEGTELDASGFETNSGLNETAGLAGYNMNNVSLSARIGSIIQVALSLLGVIFLILMIYGGYIWMLARGNETEVEKAKNIIKNAIIGLVLVMSAYAISYFVIAKLGASTMAPSG